MKDCIAISLIASFVFTFSPPQGPSPVAVSPMVVALAFWISRDAGPSTICERFPET
jgi:hypothetical protein